MKLHISHDWAKGAWTVFAVWFFGSFALSVITYIFISDGNPSDQDYCIATQIEQHRSPSDCPDIYISGYASLIRHILTSADTISMNEVREAFGKQEDEIPYGLVRIATETENSDKRIERIRRVIPSCRTSVCQQLMKGDNGIKHVSDAPNQYRKWIAESTTNRISVIQTRQGINTTAAHATSGIFSVLGLMGFLWMLLGLFRSEGDNEIRPSTVIATICFLPVVIVGLTLYALACIFLPNQTWRRRTYERNRLLKECGEDAVRYLDEIEAIESILGTEEIPETKLEEYKLRINTLRQDLEKLRRERRKTARFLNVHSTNPNVATSTHDPIGDQINTLRREVDGAIAAEQEIQAGTEQGLAERFEHLPAGVREV